MHKCPICGEKVEEVEAKCPKCGFQIVLSDKEKAKITDISIPPLRLPRTEKMMYPEKYFFAKSWLFMLICGVVGMIISIIPIVICAAVDASFSNIAYFVIAGIVIIAVVIFLLYDNGKYGGIEKRVKPSMKSIFLREDSRGNLCLELYDGLTWDAIYWRYPNKSYKKPFWIRLFFLHLPIWLSAIIVPLLIDIPVAVGCLLFFLLISSTVLFIFNVDDIICVNVYAKKYICPKCGAEMKEKTSEYSSRESVSQTGGNARSRNVKVGEVEFEDGSRDDVYGQYTYYTPVKTYRNHYTHKTFTIVCPKCNYSTGEIHKEDSVYRTRIDNKN